jgi:hypothetical protein
VRRRRPTHHLSRPHGASAASDQAQRGRPHLPYCGEHAARLPLLRGSEPALASGAPPQTARLPARRRARGLTRAPPRSRAQRLLSEEFTDLDADGAAFVDRDGRYFTPILAYLRSGAIEPPAPPLSLEGLIAEAEYFALDGLVAALRERAARPPAAPAPRLAADGLYVWADALQPELCEAVFFEAAESAALGGSLVYSRGPCARENLLALRRMPKPLPALWRESAHASKIVAHFTQRYISRGRYELDGEALLMTRGSLPSVSRAGEPGESPMATTVTVGLVLSERELLLVEPSTDHAEAERTAGLREQFGLAPSTSAARAGGALGGLGGGFKRFVLEQFD